MEQRLTRVEWLLYWRLCCQYARREAYGGSNPSCSAMANLTAPIIVTGPGTTVRTMRKPHRMGRIREVFEFNGVMRARVWFPGDRLYAYEQHHDLDALEVCHGPLYQSGSPVADPSSE